MKTGIMIGGTPAFEASVNSYVTLARDLEARGFDSLWMAHIRRHDAIMALALAGRETARLEVGTAVTPIQPRHPTAMAQQALTAQAMASGRFTLGLGLSHQPIIEGMMGLSFAHPAKTMREYLQALQPLLRAEPSRFDGELYRTNFELDITDAPGAPSVVVAALGPMMLEIAGQLSDGTLLWMTGPRTIEEYVRPRIESAAGDAGRSSPRIIAPYPMVLTNDIEAARSQVASHLERYGQLPSYRGMLDREGVDHPVEMAMIGDEKHLRRAMKRMQDVGVTDFGAALVDLGDGSVERTLDFLQASL